MSVCKTNLVMQISQVTVLIALILVGTIVMVLPVKI